MSRKDGIFCCLEVIADSHLLDPTWRRENGRNRNFGHKTNCLRLGSTGLNSFNASNMIEEMYDRIKCNIRNRVPVLKNGKEERRTPSAANWDFNFRESLSPDAADESTKPEVTLERAIIQASRRRKGNDTWTYQMPVATGLFGPSTDKASNIDLVRKRSDGEFELIELKVASNNPLYAAVEILQYGLAYAATRELCEEIGYDRNRLEILRAKEIELSVLAPMQFYSTPENGIYNLAWLEEALNDALIVFGKRFGFQMTFGFRVLDLDWKPIGGAITGSMSDISTAIDNIRPISWDGAAEL